MSVALVSARLLPRRLSAPWRSREGIGIYR
jgi:hypothetical protein